MHFAAFLSAFRKSALGDSHNQVDQRLDTHLIERKLAFLRRHLDAEFKNECSAVMTVFFVWEIVSVHRIYDIDPTSM